MLSHKYDYRSNLETSRRINWTIEEVVDGRTFDFGKPFLPEALAGTEAIGCLNAAEKLQLNHIRSRSYLALFGLIEEYILPSLIEHAGGAVHGDDDEMRAILRFAEEEAKHIQLFKWFVKAFDEGFGTPCGIIGPTKEIVDAILSHSRLGVFLATLHIEWLTQKHYVESVKDNADDRLDALFCSLLKHHWLEESQHAKLDTLVVDKIAAGLRPDEIEKGIDDYMAIGKILDGGLAAQVQLELASLQQATGRAFTAEERAEMAAALTRAYRSAFLVAGITHPNFDRSLSELSVAGHARVAELARALA